MKEYEENYIVQLKKAKTDEELSAIIKKIYDDGYNDGHEEGLSDSKSGDF